jgi:N-acetylglucosaminyldiphosphoundecaprenol N-acetyl-beta-D-mannosaminyltransferase
MNSAVIITFVNTFSYYQLLDSDCALDKIDHIFVDGSLHVKFHNIFNKNKANRASFDFSSIADDFFVYAVKQEMNIAIIGATENEIATAVSNLRNKYTGLRIVYFRNGYFHDEAERRDLYAVLGTQQIDTVIIGMGTPSQEQLAIYLKDQGLSAYIFTCGGFISQTARNVDYYHDITKKRDLRWLQRAIEFKHIRKRLLVNYPINIIRYLFEHTVLFFYKLFY